MTVDLNVNPSYPKECCKLCLYSRLGDKGALYMLQCLRYPPIITQETLGSTLLTEWPGVHADHWCGEYTKEDRPLEDRNEAHTF